MGFPRRPQRRPPIAFTPPSLRGLGEEPNWLHGLPPRPGFLLGAPVLHPGLPGLPHRRVLAAEREPLYRLIGDPPQGRAIRRHEVEDPLSALLPPVRHVALEHAAVAQGERDVAAVVERRFDGGGAG